MHKCSRCGCDPEALEKAERAGKNLIRLAENDLEKALRQRNRLALALAAAGVPRNVVELLANEGEDSMTSWRWPQ